MLLALGLCRQAPRPRTAGRRGGRRGVHAGGRRGAPGRQHGHGALHRLRLPARRPRGQPRARRGRGRRRGRPWQPAALVRRAAAWRGRARRGGRRGRRPAGGERGRRRAGSGAWRGARGRLCQQRAGSRRSAGRVRGCARAPARGCARRAARRCAGGRRRPGQGAQWGGRGERRCERDARRQGCHPDGQAPAAGCRCRAAPRATCVGRSLCLGVSASACGARAGSSGACARRSLRQMHGRGRTRGCAGRSNPARWRGWGAAPHGGRAAAAAAAPAPAPPAQDGAGQAGGGQSADADPPRGPQEADLLWWRVSDTQVRAVDWEAVSRVEAYILMYVKTTPAQP